MPPPACRWSISCACREQCNTHTRNQVEAQSCRTAGGGASDAACRRRQAPGIKWRRPAPSRHRPFPRTHTPSDTPHAPSEPERRPAPALGICPPPLPPPRSPRSQLHGRRGDPSEGFRQEQHQVGAAGGVGAGGPPPRDAASRRHDRGPHVLQPEDAEAVQRGGAAGGAGWVRHHHAAAAGAVGAARSRRAVVATQGGGSCARRTHSTAHTHTQPPPLLRWAPPPSPGWSSAAASLTVRSFSPSHGRPPWASSRWGCWALLSRSSSSPSTRRAWGGGSRAGREQGARARRERRRLTRSPAPLPQIIIGATS